MNEDFYGSVYVEYYENGNLIHTEHLNTLDGVASFNKPSVGDNVAIYHTRKSYFAEDFNARIKREKDLRHKIDRPFSKEDKKPVSKGILKRISHFIIEGVKEENSYVKVRRTYNIKKITTDTSGSSFKIDVNFVEEEILGRTKRPR